MPRGIITAHCSNLGDDIQTLAIRRLLPRYQFLIDRDALTTDQYPPQTQIILNGWYTRHTKFWPPHVNFSPLFLSFHARDTKVSNTSERICNLLLRAGGNHPLICPANRSYYLKFAPIGCRDTRTVEMFTQINVPAYFSGCITLTLAHRRVVNRDGIVFVDPFGSLPGTYYRKDLWLKIPRNLRTQAVCLSHFKPPNNIAQRFELAERHLDIFSKAKLVITNRLHVALPCLAYGTPIILLDTFHRKSRFSGYERLLQPVTTESFLNACKNGKLETLISVVDETLLNQLRVGLINEIEKYIKGQLHSDPVLPSPFNQHTLLNVEHPQ